MIHPIEGILLSALILIAMPILLGTLIALPSREFSKFLKGTKVSFFTFLFFGALQSADERISHIAGLHIS